MPVKINKKTIRFKSTEDNLKKHASDETNTV